MPQLCLAAVERQLESINVPKQMTGIVIDTPGVHRHVFFYYERARMHLCQSPPALRMLLSSRRRKGPVGEWFRTGGFWAGISSRGFVQGCCSVTPASVCWWIFVILALVCVRALGLFGLDGRNCAWWHDGAAACGIRESVCLGGKSDWELE